MWSENLCSIATKKKCKMLLVWSFGWCWTSHFSAL